MIDLYSFVVQHFRLGKKSPSGFFLTKCPMCHDDQWRAGFKFNPTGFGYNCFRGSCGHKFRWEVGEEPSTALYKLFATVGLSEDDIDDTLETDYLAAPARAQEPKGDKTEVVIKNLPTIDLPTGSFPLKDGNGSDARVQRARQFLQEEKGLNPDDYPYHLTFAMPKKEEGDFRNRVIVPFYRNGRIVFYQGRWCGEWESKIKYLNAPGVSREQVIFNLDEIYNHKKTPIILVEGVLDAIALQPFAASFLSNILTEEQIFILNKSSRRKILIPDYDSAGAVTVEQALGEDWEVSFPDWGEAKDLNEAVARYGPTKVAGMIHSGICESSVEAEIMSEYYCVDR
jgi:hypothetical protein